MEITALEKVRYDNALRNARAKEWIGGMYFCIGYGMFQYTVGIGLIMAYVLPLRRFSHTIPLLGNQKFVSGFYTVFLAGLFFLVSGTAGMTGFVIMGGLELLWVILLVIIGVVRRCLHRSREKKKIAESQAEDDFFAPQPTKEKGGDNYKPSTTVAFATPERGGGSGVHENDSNLPGIETQESVELGDAARGHNIFSAGDFGTVVEADDGDAHKEESGVVVSRSTFENKVKKRMRGMNRWTYCPERISNGQTACFSTSILLLFAILAILFVLVYTWSIHDYKLMDKGDVVVEYQNPLAAKALQFMYSFPTVATRLKLQIYVRLFTEWCGTTFTKDLSESEKEAEIGTNWVDRYSINMSLFIPSDYTNYSSVNAWFTRAIDLKYRPLPTGLEFVVSPADCRLLVYNNPKDVKIWTKGYPLVYNDLLDGEVVSGTTRYFDNGAVVIARLAPQDYHRFHSPVSGVIVSIRKVTNTYWSVSADAARSGNDAFLNTRTIVIIDAGPRIGYVAYVGIGATCVGSVIMEGSDNRNVTVGSVVERGEQLGSMNFGGSTVIMLFAQGRVLFDPTLVQRSRYAVETLSKVRESIGATR